MADEADDDRKERTGRRVMQASDFDQQTVSEEYRRLAREKRHQEMEMAKELLSRGTMKGETKAEMMLRLADLYFEEGRDIRLTEDESFREQFDACFNNPTCSTETMEPNYGKSSKWQERSIKLYKRILSEYPTFSRADEASFYLGTALWDTDQQKAGVKEFTRLVKSYPESRRVPDAYVMVGEYYFDNNDAFKALLAYKKASAYRESPKYPFAMYKLAWCYYNVGEYGNAIDTMKTVVAYSMSSDSGQKSNLQLQEEALKDLVRFFADAGEMDEAYNYFNKLGKKELIRSMLKRLASTYFEQGKFEQCIQTYRRLIAEAPHAAEAPEYQNEIISAYSKIGRKQEVVAEIERMRKTYGKNSAWATKNASDPDALEDAANYLEKNLRTVASKYHEEARKLGPAGIESYQLAYNAYGVYVAEYPDGKHAYEMNYGFAELLWEIKRYDESYDQYMKVVKIDPKGKHSKFCADGAIFASKEMIKKTGGSKTAGGPGKSTEPIPLTDWENKKLAALDQYSELFPDDQKTVGVIYESAYLLYNRNHFKDASDRFRIVISMNPASTQSEQAANLILDAFVLTEDYRNLKEVSKAFYDQPELGSTANFKKEIYNLYEEASFKLIEVDYESKEDWAGAADAFIAFHTEFPQSKVGDKALNNAGVYYHKTKQTQKAMETRLKFVQTYPKSDYYKQNVAGLGFDYENLADFAEAANWYEKLFALDKDHEGASAAIFSAAAFRVALGDWQGGVKNYQQYLAAYPDKDNVSEVTLVIAKTYEENGAYDQAAKVYLSFFDAKDTTATGDELMFARLHYGQALKETGQESKALGSYEDSLKWFEKAQGSGVEFEQGIEFAAEMMFDLSEAKYENYVALAITGPGAGASRQMQDKVSGEQLKDKAKTLQEVEAAYVQIIQTGAGEWGIATLVRLGQAYEDMADKLRTAYAPDYLTEDQVELYRMNLEDLAYPQEEKAIEAYNTALGKSYELNLYNENTAFASRRLGELRPNDFPGFYEEVITPDFTSAAVTETTFETSY